jgi:hypothetical protein
LVLFTSVAKKIHKKYGFDFTETFYSLVNPFIVIVVLTFSITMRWHITQLDVNNAFMNDLLEEEVFMEKPPTLKPPRPFMASNKIQGPGLNVSTRL